MANDIANPFGGSTSMANRQEMAKRAAESANKAPSAGAPNGSEYMNFSGKQGRYTIGKDKREIDNDEYWLLNVGSFEDGYICWKGGKPASTRMSNIYTGEALATPASDELGPFNEQKGEGWYQAKGWVAKSLDEGEQGYFKNNSVSGVAEMAEMISEVSARLGAGKSCWPVFAYDKEGFEAQGFKNFKPIFDVKGWLDDEAIAGLGEDDYDIEELMTESAARDEGEVQEKVALSKPSPKRGGRKEADAQAKALQAKADKEAAAEAEAEAAAEEVAEEDEITPPSKRRRRTAR